VRGDERRSPDPSAHRVHGECGRPVARV